MLVFGDHVRRCDPRGALDELDARLAELAGLPARLARHAALVGAFVDASELAQGLADVELARTGRDARSPHVDASIDVLVELARAIARSWAQRFAPVAPLGARAGLRELAEAALPDQVELRRAEGYAFYALYPEAYLAAARRAIAEAPGPRQVIGIRSIGTGLAAVVAAATGAPAPATVRPRGDPLRRELAVEPSLIAEWTTGAGTLAIVDEGPGLSGSSFGAVADLLEHHGVARERLEMYPGHAGDLGPLASTRHRARWQHVRRYPADADAVLLDPEAGLAQWLVDLVGPLDRPLEDLSAGAWRTKQCVHPAAWPPCIAQQERRKFLVRAGGATWIARFAGLGRDGERAHARARALHAARFTPEVAGLCHGFLVERWLADAAPLDLLRIDRVRLVEHAGRYLGFRARAFPASAERGAPLVQLLEMVRRNALLGGLDAAAIDRWSRTWSPALGALEARNRRIEIDGKLHAWEWLVRRDGRLVKTDAIDHHAAHDLIGCQDVAWDLAGAELELALVPAEARQLAGVVAGVLDRDVDPELLAFLRPCYLAFQLGRHELAIASADLADAARLRHVVARYAERLREALP